MPESTLPERVFYEIIEDLRDFLDILTLVGGWVPFVYARYLWRLPIPSIVTTADIDFGISDKSSLPLGRTVYETLSLLDYSERHVRLGRLQPVVFYRAGKIPVEFIADTRSDHKVMVRTLGPQIHINRIDGFAFLLEERISVRIELKTGALAVFCPKPAAFLYNKLGIFSSREDEFKRAKDLYSAYFVLRFCPEPAEVYRQVRLYRERRVFPHIDSELRSFFRTLTSQGPLWIEKENGPDEFIEDVRRDAFARFSELRRNVFG